MQEGGILRIVILSGTSNDRISYAGIGSRRTPKDVLKLIDLFAMAVGPDTVLRSGCADGADKRFAFGSTLGYGLVETYVPWEKFCGCDRGFLPLPAAFEIAEYYHPNYHSLRPGAQRLHARNSHQILGRRLDDPVAFVVCWTPDGSTGRTTAKTGGTGQAIRIAADYDIPIKNLARPEHRAEIEALIADAT